MRGDVIQPGELDRLSFERWRAAATTTVPASPFYDPAWTQLVARHRASSRVAVAEIDGHGVWLPFDRAGARAIPVGGTLSDYHGLVTTAPELPPLPTLLRACHLESYSFDHVPPGQPFAGLGQPSGASHVVELQRGVEPYRAAIKAKGSDLFGRLRRSRQQAERDHGELRLEPDCQAPQVLQQLFTWKSAQYLRSGVPDLFAEPSHSRLCVDLAQADAPAFKGLLSALWLGDALVAAHLGPRSGSLLHWWLPAYDTAFSRYSPGSLLLSAVIEASPDLGVTQIDLGKGDEQYKQRFATTSIPMYKGTVVARGLPRLVHAAGRARNRARAHLARHYATGPGGRP